MARSNGAWLGLASAGKSYYDLVQALRDLGIGEDELEELGIRVAKFGMTFPLDGEFAREFARGLETILVIEEKRSFLELHLRDALYRMAARPVDSRQDRRRGRAAVPAGRRTGSGQDRQGGRRTAGDTRGTTEHVAARVHFIDDVAARPRELLRVAAAEFLFRLPAQPVDAAAARPGRRRRHRLPHHGDAADRFQPQLFVPDADGRRRRAVDRHGAVRRP